MIKPNWIAHNRTFLYNDVIVTAIVEIKIKNGWDIVLCLASGVNISLLSQLPPDWVFVPFCGGNYERKFRIFPEKKIIIYDDLNKEEELELLLETIIMANSCIENKECKNGEIRRK